MDAVVYPDTKLMLASGRGDVAAFEILALPAPTEEMVSGRLAPADDLRQQLKKINQTCTQGHDDEARRKLFAVRGAHPQRTSPDDLGKRQRQS